MKQLAPVLAAIALAAPVAVAAAEPPIHPGCWESTNEVLSPFHTTSTTRRFISAADVDRFLTGPINHHYTCVYPTHEVANGHLVMKGVCTDNKGRKVDIDSHGAYTADSFHVEANIATKVLGLPLSGRARTDARRIGDSCPATEASR
ncbi:MAG: DUF3617 family protein [Alphaproteobacteria bacterium]|nr:DUF3617 family protein [Alphaproteobacteria bacterium]